MQATSIPMCVCRIYWSHWWVTAIPVCFRHVQWVFKAYAFIKMNPKKYLEKNFSRHSFSIKTPITSSCLHLRLLYGTLVSKRKHNFQLSQKKRGLSSSKFRLKIIQNRFHIWKRSRSNVSEYVSNTFESSYAPIDRSIFKITKTNLQKCWNPRF